MRELERLARAAEAEAEAAAADVTAETAQAETRLQRSIRLAAVAARAREAADLDAVRFRRRAAWIVARLALLALLLWAAWRVGYESGYLAAVYGSVTNHG